MELMPVSITAFADAREEASFVLARLMSRLSPGEHVVRLGVDMDGLDRPLGATLSITVTGDGTSDDLLEVESKYFDNFALMLACSLAQTLCRGVMCLRSPTKDQKRLCLHRTSLELESGHPDRVQCGTSGAVDWSG